MFETKSADIRRFFDFLGAFFYSSIGSFMVWQDSIRYSQQHKFIFLPLFILAGMSIFLSAYYLVWRFVNTKFLLGYANFFMISALSVTTIGFLIIVIMAALNRLEFYYLRTSLTEVILFYWATSLPMAFFWVIGWLTAWKFTGRNFLR